MSPTTGPHVANDSVLDVTAGARSAAAVSSDTPLHADHSTPSTIPTPRGMSEQQCRGGLVGPNRLSTRPRRTPDPARTAEKLRTVLWGWAGKPVDDAALEEVARVREALRGDLGEPLCGHLTGQRWTGCTPESLRCWIIR
jgi:hypothetical protein